MGVGGGGDFWVPMVVRYVGVGVSVQGGLGPRGVWGYL